MSYKNVYFTSPEPILRQIDFVDGSPCNVASSTSFVEAKFIADGAKKDYNSSTSSLALVEASPYYDRVASMITEFETAIAETAIRPEEPTLLVDSEATNILIAEIRHQDPISFATEYPFLQERLSRGVYISPVEISEFKTEYSILSVSSYLGSYTKYEYMSSLNSFYDKGAVYSRTSANFCSLLQSVFTNARAYYDDIKDTIQRIKDFIEDVKNFSLKRLVNEAKENIRRTVDDIVRRYKRMLKDIRLMFEDVASFPVAVQKKFRRLKTDAEAFVEGGSETIKKECDNMIDRIMTMFDKLDMDEIQYIIYRICGFLSGIEMAYESVMLPLNHMKNNYKDVREIYYKRTYYNSAFATASGATRYSREQLEGGVSQQRDIVYQQGGIRSDTIPVSNMEIDGVPSWYEVRQGGTGDPRILLSGNNSGAYNVSSAGSRNMGRASWDNCNPDALVKLMRFQKIFSERMGRNIQLVINSAFRSDAYNRLVGGAGRSNHMSGIAFDVAAVNWNFIKDQNAFVECARMAGFNGIGYYQRSNFIHIDTRSKYTVWHS